VGDGGVRADVHPRLFLPIPVGGRFTLTPFLGGRATYYNRRAVGLSVIDNTTVEETIHDDRVRLQIEGGIEAETRASRIFQLDGAGGLAALQHVVEPRVELLEIRGINQKALPQYEGVVDQRQASRGQFPIDKIGRVNQLTYSLVNRINAKTVSGPDQEPVRWEMARLTLSQTFNIRKAISGSQPFEDLIGDVIVQPTSFLRFRADGVYNMEGLGFRAANTDVTATYRDVAVMLGSRFDDIAGANYVTGQVSAKLLANLDGHVAVGYDVRQNTSVENRFGFDWRFQCFAISAEYVNRHKNENEFRFSINLLGVGPIGTKLGLP
jgi:LPS transport system D